MKKLLLVVAVLGLVGCSSVEQHNGRNSMLIQNVLIEPTPMQADIEVGQKISGTAVCEKWFGFTTSQPNKLTYGANLQVPAGNLASSKCTRGAVYDALNRSKADIIIAPQYTTIQEAHVCIFGACVHRADRVTVTGYKGTIKRIAPMERNIVIERQKQGISIQAEETAETKGTILSNLL